MSNRPTVAHREVLKATYLAYVNDFLTLGAFAEWLDIDPSYAAVLVAAGRELHEEDAVRERAVPKRVRLVRPITMPPPPPAPPVQPSLLRQWLVWGAAIAGRALAVLLGLLAIVLVLHGIFGG
jgi:hypothetical protein